MKTFRWVRMTSLGAYVLTPSSAQGAAGYTGVRAVMKQKNKGKTGVFSLQSHACSVSQ